MPCFDYYYELECFSCNKDFQFEKIEEVGREIEGGFICWACSDKADMLNDLRMKNGCDC